MIYCGLYLRTSVDSNFLIIFLLSVAQTFQHIFNLNSLIYKIIHEHYFSNPDFTLDKFLLEPLEQCLLSNNIMDYYVVSQGKTSIPGVDDGEELELTDVRKFTERWHKSLQKFEIV